MYVNHFFLFVNTICRCDFFFQSTVRCTEKKIWIIQFKKKKKKAQRCSGSHHFQNWRQGFGKKLEMSGSARSVLSIIYTFWHWGFSELHSSNRCHKFRVSNRACSYAEVSLIRVQLLPNFWQMGIDLEGGTGSCCLWVLFPSLARAVGSRVECRPYQGLPGLMPNWNADSEREEGLCSSRPRDGELVSGLLKVIQLIGPTPWSSALLWSRQPVWGLANRGASFESCSSTHCVPWVNFTVWAASSLSLKEIDGLPLHRLVRFFAKAENKTRWGDVSRVPLPPYSSSTSFLLLNPEPPSHTALGL